MTIKTVF